MANRAATRKILFLLAILGLSGLNGACSGDSGSASLEIVQGDSIVFIGNTFAERMHLFGYFEALLHSKYPDHRLKIRNMGWSGDEVALRPRPFRFGDMHRYLTEHEVDVIFACFGMNESFGGTGSLPQFQADLDALVEALQAHRYNGESPPRIVLVSPIAHEDLGGHLPDGIEHNESLRRYTEAIAEAAEEYGLPFVDLFTPTQELYPASAQKLTSNGIHLTSYGYWNVSQIMARSLGLVETIAPVSAAGDPTAGGLRRAIYDKNYSFFFRWRAPNMEYIHGQRRTLPGAELMPEELAQLAHIIEQLEAKIWEMAKPRPEDVWRELPPDRPLWIDPPRYTDIQVAPIPAREEPTEPPEEEEESEREILSVEDALKSFHLPDGYAINLYASEEEFPIANPVAMNFDAEGRLWVANTPTWPHPIPGRQPSDSIVILEDSDRDGVADEHTVFIDKLNMIHGFALGDGGAYISQTPNIIHAEDTDGDRQADRFRVVLQGFGGEDVEHSISNYKWGPDGALYFMEGIFFRTQVETPYGPRRVRNGGVYRYEPLTERFDPIVSYAFWNPWGQVFDSWGQNIVLDASSHDYFNTSVLSANFVYPKEKENEHRSLSFAPRGLGPAAGINLVRSSHFPEEAQGRFLAGQLSGGFRGIRWYEISEDGTTYDVDQLTPELLRSTDPYFRPVATTFGPDGALYVADFSSALIENTSEPKRDPGRDHAHGRIWRISYVDRPLSTPMKITGEPVPVLLGLLGSRESTTRRFARRELQERGAEDVLPPLREWLAGFDSSDPDHERYLLEALWIHEGLNVVEPGLLRRLLRAENPHARAAATRVLRSRQNTIDGAIALLEELVEDDDARVRLEAVLASGFSDSDRARDVALLVTKHPMDVGTRHALDETMDYFDRVRSDVDPREIELPTFPEGIAYVLGRLTNEQLANIEPTEPVYAEMLVRDDLDTSLRRTAIVELASIRGTSQLTELLGGIARSERSEGRRRRALNDLVQILMMAQPPDLTREREALVALATGTEHVALSRQAAYAALMIADGDEAVWQLASRSDATLLDLLAGVPLIPDPSARAALYPRVTPLIHDATNRDLRRAAIRASAFIPGHEEETFTLLAELVESGTERDAAVEALRDLSATRWPKHRIGELTDSVLDYLRTEAAEQRGTPEFKRALQLGDELASLLPSARGREVREALRGLGIRTVTIRAMPHLLLYDKTLIVVEAGEPVEITFENPGVMNHNLVIVAPGTMEQIGLAADLLIGRPARPDGSKFVPDSVDVLQPTPLVEPRASATFTFVAPDVTGEYPFLCSVPGHWVSMNGVMLVVDDVDAWMEENAGEVSGLQPTATAFVRNWTLADMVNDLDRLAVGRSLDRGEQLFTVFCAACHQARATGGAIGPDLSESSARLGPTEMLAQVIEPATSIEAQYVIWTIELTDGRTVYGRVEDPDAGTIRIVENPQSSSAAIEIPRDRIESMKPSNLSTMPTGLLNTLSREQILDLLAYIRSDRIQDD